MQKKVLHLFQDFYVFRFCKKYEKKIILFAADHIVYAFLFLNSHLVIKNIHISFNYFVLFLKKLFI